MADRTLETDADTSARMKRIRQRNTKPEIMLRRWLWLRGVRYRCCVSRLPGSPDIANRKRRWAIFVHGCFWHGHVGCAKATVPKRNTEFWRSKIADNKRRDALKVKALRKLGFDVVTLWQCQVERVVRSDHHTKLRRLTALPARLRLRVPEARPVRVEHRPT